MPVVVHCNLNLYLQQHLESYGQCKEQLNGVLSGQKMKFGTQLPNGQIAKPPATVITKKSLNRFFKTEK